jgi:hypothetical protein
MAQEECTEEFKLTILNKGNRLGCPQCNGISPSSCCRCRGNTMMMHWFLTPTGWAYFTELKGEELAEAERILQNV